MKCTDPLSYKTFCWHIKPLYKGGFHDIIYDMDHRVESPKRLSKSPLGDNVHYYNDVIMGVIASQIPSLTIVYSTVYSGADQRKHQSSASVAFVRGIHRWSGNSPHKWPVTRKMSDDVIMLALNWAGVQSLLNRRYPAHIHLMVVIIQKGSCLKTFK